MLLHASLALTSLAAPADDDPVTPSGTPPELGLVRWERRLEPALEGARSSARPVLLLFQEVPG